MSQKSTTTTTSFIVSSDESLNKPLPSSSSLCSSASSSSQSTYTSNNTNNNINMTTSDSIRINQCLGYTTDGNIMPQQEANLKQHNSRLHSQRALTSMCVPPPPPPPSCPNESFYGCLNNNNSNNINSNSIHQQVSMHNRGPSNIFSSGAYSHAGQSLTEHSNSTIHNQSQIINNHSPTNQKNSLNSNHHNIETSITDTLMPINVKSMLLHGISGDEVLKNWLSSIKCEEYFKNFVDNGYDLHIITRMTPQDLTAIGCRTPTLRKKLLMEIKRLNIEDDIPKVKPNSLDEWLNSLRLGHYYNQLCNEGLDTVDKVCKLTWEDLEEIGITTLGHQKRLLMGIEKLQKSAQQLEEHQADNPIYDVHPNHRMSLNGSAITDNRFGTMSRVRSGFFQTRSSANLDRRGMPVATVMPALKHVNSSLANSTETGLMKDSGAINERLCDSNGIYSSREQVVKMSDLTTTLKRTNPPLPPVRVDSLKRPQSGDCQSIYGNSFSVVASNGGINSSSVYGTATSFSRTPKLGTLTATTNKMLTVGGHIQTVDSNKDQQVKPIREAPLPPIAVLSSLTIPERIVEEGTTATGAFSAINSIPCVSSTIGNNITSANATTTQICDPNSLIGHQLAGADEFPPPPPCQ